MKKAANAATCFIWIFIGSDLVAKRTLDLARQVLGFALAFLRSAFGFEVRIFGRTASRLFRVSCNFVAKPFGFVS